MLPSLVQVPISVLKPCDTVMLMKALLGIAQADPGAAVDFNRRLVVELDQCLHSIVRVAEGACKYWGRRRGEDKVRQRRGWDRRRGRGDARDDDRGEESGEEEAARIG